jgi:signal transduction histidine kinase
MANMSHELRTPLNAIIGLSQVMSDQLLGALPKRYATYADDIKSSGEHLLGIINDILDISKIEAGKITLNDEVFDLSAFVRGSLPSVSLLAAARGVSLVLDLAADLPAVRGDEARLRQVLLNLLSNAIKFTPDSGAVTVHAKVETDGSLRLSVTDTGIGMTPHEVAIALERFRQVDETYTKRFEGTGLGLPIAKELVALHGGALEVVSAPGEGTTVHVHLPADRVVSQTAPDMVPQIA